MGWFETFVQLESFSGKTIITYLLLPFTLAITLLYFFRRQKKIWLIDQIPGPKTIPILGNALDVNVSPRELFDLFAKKFCEYDSSISRVWMGQEPNCILYKAKAVEIILSSQKHIYKSFDYKFLQPWLGTGLLTSTGKKWHHRRKMLTPAFHFKILEDFLEVFNAQSSKLVTKLEKKADGEPFDIFHFITLCTLDIILESAMGRKINAQDNSESEYIKAVYRVGAIVQHRTFRPWLHPNFLFNLTSLSREQQSCLKTLHSFSYETIRERRREYKILKEIKEKQGKSEKEEEISGKKKRLAFLDLLLEYGDGTGSSSLSDEDLREEVDTFMFEGHDTTAAAINWSLYLLGSHPDIQDKVFEELDAIFGDSDRPATIGDLREMKYLECCIKEALRLFPSVPFFARELREDVVVDGYKVPTGTTMLIVTYRLHRDPAQFPEPELFQPERFFPENCANRHPYAYIPFSAGPRNCIGQKFAQMEEKTVISTVLRNYRVESTVRRENLKILGELILRPEDGNTLKLFPRK